MPKSWQGINNDAHKGNGQRTPVFSDAQYDAMLAGEWVGPQGPPGLPGQAFTWLGDWNSSTLYLAGDGVTANGSAYVAITDNLNDQPPSVNWDLFASKGNTGATGPSGPQGASGSQGIAGPTGATGPQGDDGDPGDIGIPGASGPPGAIGLIGPPGFDGEDGDSFSMVRVPDATVATVPLNSSDYNASPTGGWTVGGGVSTVNIVYAYLAKNLILVAFDIENTTVTGTPTILTFPIPGGGTAAYTVWSSYSLQIGGSYSASVLEVVAGGSAIALYRTVGRTSSNWAAGTLQVQGQVIIPLQ